MSSAHAGGVARAHAFVCVCVCVWFGWCGYAVCVYQSNSVCPHQQMPAQQGAFPPAPLRRLTASMNGENDESQRRFHGGRKIASFAVQTSHHQQWRPPLTLNSSSSASFQNCIRILAAISSLAASLNKRKNNIKDSNRVWSKACIHIHKRHIHTYMHACIHTHKCTHQFTHQHEHADEESTLLPWC